jgi:hypothetical protein
LKWQRHEELNADNISLHSTLVLRTPWTVEKQANLSYTQKVLNIFQEEVNATRILPKRGVAGEELFAKSALTVYTKIESPDSFCAVVHL